MTEPPRPPGEGNPSDPTEPYNYPPPSHGTPPPPPPPAYGSPAPGSDAGYGSTPPGSGAPYGQQQPYGQQPYGGGYPSSSANDDKTWILVAHFGGAAGAFLGAGCAGWIAPLVALLVQGPKSPVARAEAIKALNFQILWSIIALIGWITTCAIIGFIIAPVATLIAAIIGVIAGVKASNNEPYNYPLTVSIIK
ncbi:DUF4870 domain-containing protein [Winogradskya humida]|uniref:DUF4870 domain-containing protein n=1 Tax=Winogradskya humida TaxID=113566 RepID=A0ABQ4A0J9_9ACTN|nr:DUF4870 domain-containing protein [Actinoplanes humidus]GIE24395.1 hypothetical protein Ahu01nite_074970 [Actinoplanes humidus]